MAIAPPALAVAKFSIGPPRFELKLSPGTEATVLIDAVNHGEEDLRLKAYASDFELDPDGNVSYPKSRGTRSCVSWFRFNPQISELPIAGSDAVRATVVIPADAGGTYWCALFLEDIPSPPKKRANQVLALQVGVRVGSIVYLDVGTRAEPRLNVEGISALPGAAAGQIEITADIAHHGGGFLRPQGKWEFVSGNDEVVETAEVGFPLLPNHRRRLRWAVNPPPGTYRARLSLDFGAPKRLVAETVVNVAPPGPAAGSKTYPLSRPRTDSHRPAPPSAPPVAPPGVQEAPGDPPAAAPVPASEDPPARAASARQEWLARAEKDRRRLEQQSGARYAIQVQLACELDSLAPASREGGSRFWLLPATFQGRSCFRLFWGLYATRLDAEKAKAEVPSFFSKVGGRPAVVKVDDVISR